MLRQLAALVPGLAVTTQFRDWQSGGAQLLPTEAFITAVGKPEPLAAASMPPMRQPPGWALLEMLDSPTAPTSSVCCSPQESFSLLAAMALWAGLRIASGELQAEVLVVAAPAVSAGSGARHRPVLAYPPTGRTVGS
jgi:hypothetical protein